MAQEELNRVLEGAWELVRRIEPARGNVTAEQVIDVRTALEQVAAVRAAQAAAGAPSESDEATQIDGATAAIYARGAAIAIAGGDETNAERWLAVAEQLSRDDDQRAEIAAARRSQERYRALVHGRNLIANGHEPAARKLWKPLAQEASDAISRAAADELKAPRPLGPHDSAPTLSRINGIGVGFYGRRDEWPDGSYATTHCISVLWIPVFALSAWRVRDQGGGYQIFAREQLSSFARQSRWAVLGAVVLLVTVLGISSYVADPGRLASQRWDEALELAQHGDAETALQRLDGELARDVSLVDQSSAERAGAEVVRLTASYVASPLTADKVEQAVRVVRRYQALPERAKPGAAQGALFALVDRWMSQLGERDTISSGEAQLALATAASEVAPAGRKVQLDAHVLATRLVLAAAKQADWPLDALAILVGPTAKLAPGAATEAADKLVERIAACPSLLLDAGGDVEGWLAATHNADLRAQVASSRDAARAGRSAAEADGVTPKQLAEMAAQRPWDQYVALALAQDEAGAGKLDAAAARLARLGPPGMRVRQARFVLAQITAAQGKLEDADTQLTSLLGTRVSRFTAASAALHDAARTAQERIAAALRAGDVPDDLKRRHQQANETERRELVDGWVDEQMKNDAALIRARDGYIALGDVVPMALAAGSIKLRRAQAMSGPARDQMLQDAERTFLAIRSEAEGQPAFRLGLGEIYARLGKTTESDAELTAVLASSDPQLKLRVAGVYRNIGSVGRAKQIATEVFSSGVTSTQSDAAKLLGLLTTDEEAEGWYRKADQTDRFVRTSLLELEARRLQREGQTGECAVKFAAAAKLHLATANAVDASGYNNAAVAYEQSFDCSSDPQALRDAVAALNRAYRSAPEDPIVTGNLASLLDRDGQLRVLARHINVRALRLEYRDITSVIARLLDGAERAGVLAELAADPGVRRARELFAQAEVLSPNAGEIYAHRLADAVVRRDVDAAAAVVERARHAKGIDVSDAAAQRERWLSGADDAKFLAPAERTRTRLAPMLARSGLDPRTRAVGWYLFARSLGELGLHKASPELLAQARDAAGKAMELWPVLDGSSLIVTALIDEAGLSGDAKAWITGRRLRSTVALLDKLTVDHVPLAAKIAASTQWAAVAGHARAGLSQPGVDALRLARRLGDPALEARARAVLDDKLARLALELAVVLDPTSETAREDLAYLERR